MKRISVLILATCVIFTTFSFPIYAADTIDAFTVSVTGFGIGVGKNDVRLSLSDDRLEVVSGSLTGKFTEDNLTREQQNYRFVVSVRIKADVSAYFSKELAKENIQISGIGSMSKITLTDTRKAVVLSISLDTPKSDKTIAEEKEAEAKKHKHCYCGGYIVIGDHTSHKELTFTPWDGKSKISYNSSNEAFLYLTEDAVRSSALSVPGGKSVTLCMNGHSITTQKKDRIFNINIKSRLRLCDCTRSDKSIIGGGKAEYGGGIHNNGILELYGGIISKNEGGYGGGVYNNANFYMYGGDIYNNKAIHGGGVWNDNDSTTNFIMYEGEIGVNVASCGGAIWNNDGARLTLKGGNVIENVAGTGGGGIWNNDKAKIEIDGGKILGNVAKYGGGVWNNGGTLTIKSGNVSKNMATTTIQDKPDGWGGGIWNNDKGIIYMTGGEVTFNKAFSGGGVWCNDSSDFLMSGGVIADNEAEYGAGIYIQRNDKTAVPGTFRLTGKAGIVYNHASQAGGGAYIKGVLNIDGEGEVVINTCDNNPEYADSASETCGVVNHNKGMPTQFVDVPADAYYLEPVKWALTKGITSGTTDITFSPDDKCNTGQILTFLWRAAGSPEVKITHNFADVYKTDYFYMAAHWANSLGIVERALYPNFSCNRLSAVYYIWCAAGKPACKTPVKFTDVQDSKYATYHDAIAWAVEKGITGGTSATTFSPGKSCTRAEIITLLYRAFK